LPIDPRLPSELATASNRRGADRRRRHWFALLIGSFRVRRRRVRRAGEHRMSSLDWHDSQWLAVAILILLLSVTDAFMTLTLINLGAVELNPFMAPLVTGSGRSFALWKLGLTSGGVVILILLARARVFRRLPVAVILYLVLIGYAVLVCYEVWLLERLLFMNT